MWRRRKMGRERSSHLFAAGVAVGVLPLFAGCVPYQQLKQARDELEQAKAVNNDLLRKYNQVVQKLKTRESGGGISQEAYDQALGELAQLRQQLKERAPMTVPFAPEDFAKVSPEVQEEEGGMALGEHLLFQPGVAQLKSSQIAILDEIAGILTSKYSGERIIVEGHTDNVPLQKTLKLHEDNSNLGYKRARSVFKYLKDRGIPEDQMVVMTYGYMKPVDPTTQNTDDGRRLNRRVVIRRGGFKI